MKKIHLQKYIIIFLRKETRFPQQYFLEQNIPQSINVHSPTWRFASPHGWRGAIHDSTHAYNVFPRATMCISLWIIIRIQITRYVARVGRKQNVHSNTYARSQKHERDRERVHTYTNAYDFLSRGETIVGRRVGVSQTADTTMPASFHIKSLSESRISPVNCPGTRTSPPADRGKRKDAPSSRGENSATRRLRF